MNPDVSIAGEAEQMAAAIESWADIGVSHILLDPVARGGVAGRLEAIRAFMTDVAPNVAGGVE